MRGFLGATRCERDALDRCSRYSVPTTASNTKLPFQRHSSYGIWLRAACRQRCRLPSAMRAQRTSVHDRGSTPARSRAEDTQQQRLAPVAVLVALAASAQAQQQATAIRTLRRKRRRRRLRRAAGCLRRPPPTLPPHRTRYRRRRPRHRVQDAPVKLEIGNAQVSEPIAAPVAESVTAFAPVQAVSLRGVMSGSLRRSRSPCRRKRCSRRNQRIRMALRRRLQRCPPHDGLDSDPTRTRAPQLPAGYHPLRHAGRAGSRYSVLERALAEVETFVNEADLDSAWSRRRRVSLAASGAAAFRR